MVHVEATIANRVSSKGEAVFKCRKYNHFAKVCRFQSHTTPKTGHIEVHSVRETQEDFDSELFVDAVRAAAEENGDSAYANIEL